MRCTAKKPEIIPARDRMTARRHGGALRAILLMAPSLAQADATIVNVATPSIGSDLGASALPYALIHPNAWKVSAW